MPLYLGHVQCDRLAAEVYKCIPPASNVTFFDTDFDYILGHESDGLRLYQPIEGYLCDLSMSSEFHAKMTREPRIGSLGKSGANRPPSEGVECRLGSSIIKTASPQKKALANPGERSNGATYIGPLFTLPGTPRRHSPRHCATAWTTCLLWLARP